MSIADIRKNAPRHPPGPEAAIRLAISKLLGNFHASIRWTLMHYAPRHLENKKVRALSATKDPMVKSILATLMEEGRNQLRHSMFRHTVRDAADKTADSVTRQVAAAVNPEPMKYDPDLSDETSMLADGIYDDAFSRIGESVERASEVLGIWANLEEPEVDDLGIKLDEGLSGVLGSSLAAAGLLFGYAFAEMNKAAQKEAGVEKYMWVSQHDSRTRPEHLALDGEIFDADEKPLSAEDSSLGDDDFAPGEDVNCRCVAAPVPPEEEE